MEFFAALALSNGSASLLAFRIGRSIERPVQNLPETMQKLSDGDTDVAIADTMNSMDAGTKQNANLSGSCASSAKFLADAALCLKSHVAFFTGGAADATPQQQTG